MRESKIEEYLQKKVKAIGGIAYKFTSPSNRSVPDRLCIFPKGVIKFVEIKAPGKKPTPLQALTIKRIRNLGQEVLIIDTKEGVDIFINSIMEDL